ncbi:Lipid A export ATP-binding/permease protein MsbA [Paenibacillus nuruki]|uniref:Lipid A export ATP-binding/permease protein MsbA n=1 Tax=Paenibacillus nuruki TaxID=1886670 RepID=A0A1E3KYB1_9BACL|nr:ABC transporter ATP-binding protein [Paenibacillus nuruki]ODP26552.1 Lipid A export ATP-binding/permease protein MsbA [Paenibacillus nuruki]
MTVLFSFLKKYRVAAFLALGMMLVELALELLQPFLISKIIDDGVTQKDISTVLLWGGILTGGTIIAFFAGIFGSFYAAHASQGLGYDLREAVYNKVQSFSYALFNRFSSSSLITRLTNDITQLQDMVFMGLRFMLRMPLLVVGSSVMALLVNVKLGLLLVVGIPILLFFVIIIMRKASGLFQQVQRRLDTVNSVMQENLTGMRLIRVFVRKNHERQRFEERSSNLMQGTVSALRLTETTMPFILLITNASIIAVLWYGHLDIIVGQASVGEVVAIINYAMRTMGALSAFSMIVASFSRAKASAERIQEVMFTVEDERPLDNQDQYVAGSSSVSASQSSDVYEVGVAFRQVSFHYPGTEAQVLKNIDFTARAGVTTAIMGSTGSGKSSLVQLILRLYDSDQGEIDVLDRRIQELDDHQLRGLIGYVPQEIVLFTGSIRENIAWGYEHATLEEIQEAARIAQIHDTIMNLPHGYDTLLGQRGVNLSGGQKQRISIARALVRRPAILLLDDSTSALDVRTESLLLDALRELSCTTLLITQKISSTIRADQVLLLSDGQLIAQGDHTHLLATSELYQQIYASQFGKEELEHVESVN